MVWRTRGSVDNGKRLRRIGTLACNPWTKLPHSEKGRRGGSMQNKALVSLCETNTWCFLWNVSLTNRTSFSRDYGSDKAINGWKEFRFTANVNLSFPGAAQTQPRLWQIWVSWGAGQCERPLNTLAPEILTRSSISHVQICMGTELIKHGSILPSICHLPVETNDCFLLSWDMQPREVPTGAKTVKAGVLSWASPCESVPFSWNLPVPLPKPSYRPFVLSFCSSITACCAARKESAFSSAMSSNSSAVSLPHCSGPEKVAQHQSSLSQSSSFYSPGISCPACNNNKLSILSFVTNISSPKAFSHAHWNQWPFLLD